MQKHTKIYFSYFGYGEQEFRPCEICGGHAGSVHHIDPKRSGGSKTKDYIENLMGLCIRHHKECDDRKYTYEEQMSIHSAFMNDQIPLFER